MLVDYFCHEHFALDVRVEAVIGPLWCQHSVGIVIEIWLQVNIVLLAADVFVDGLHLYEPVWISRCAEGPHDISWINWRQSQKNRPDVVFLALFHYGIQVINNHFCSNMACPEAVRACHDNEISWPYREYIGFKAL